jgi:hypothetical protein
MARAAARSQPERRAAAALERLRARLVLCQEVRAGLLQLGHDPDTAVMLVRNEAFNREALAALPPGTELDPAAPGAGSAAAPRAEQSPMEAEKSEKFQRTIERLVTNYCDPANTANLTKDSLLMLWAYVVTRTARQNARSGSPDGDSDRDH